MISLKLPVCTHLGEGSVKVVLFSEIIRRENAKKVVVFTDQGVRQSGVCDVLLRELADVSYAVLDDIPREPSYLDVEKIAGQLEAMACDLIVAIGGGSVMDTAKLCSILQGRPLYHPRSAARPRTGAQAGKEDGVPAHHLRHRV